MVSWLFFFIVFFWVMKGWRVRVDVIVRRKKKGGARCDAVEKI